MQEVKPCVAKYVRVSKKLIETNKVASKLREEKKIIELELGDILKSPEFSGINSIAIPDDGSTIKIQRPETWTKSWYLSKKDLYEHINNYFSSTNQPTAEGCYNHVVGEQKNLLVSKDFSLTYVPKENMDEE